MRKYTGVAVMMVVACVLFSPSLFAQSATDATISHAVSMRVNGISIIGLNSTAPVELAVNVPASGGMNAVGSTDSSKRLQYTSILERGMSRRITVNMNSGAQTPSGTGLYLEAIGVPGSCGTAARQVRLSDEPQNLITDIGSGRTGSEGVMLQYNFEIDAFESLVIGESQTVAVIFTMAEAS
ncbi:MAG: hypothetical protein EHM28_14450 [Spirochaetaceae bacterium]|nr:MAG: hypothetical protein EHM28_14450 [Spirochaetaceae bacterium]